MGRLLGYMANRSDRLRDVLHQERPLLGGDAQAVDGWGIGFYQGDEVLHKKRPAPTGEPVDLEAIAGDVRAHCVVMHLRTATVGDFRAENTHPFRMRHWMFAHNGTVDRFEQIREPLVAAMPDFLRRDIRGETDSEHVFHAILSFLHDSGQLESGDPDAGAVSASIRSAVVLVDRLASEVGAKPATLNLVLTNGRRMWALRRGAPFLVTERRGLHDPVTRESRPSPRTEAEAAALRYVLMWSDGPTEAPGTRPIGEGEIACVDRDLRVTYDSGA